MTRGVSGSSGVALVTGATGFLGGRLAERLVESGRHVRALVRAGSDISSLKRLGVELVAGDLERPDTLTRAVEAASSVFHCAALATDWAPLEAYVRANIDGTRNLIDATLRAASVARFVHVSSTDVYGYPATACDESHPLSRCGLPYNETKIGGEELVQDAVAHRGLRAVIVRPATIYGPRAVATVGTIADALERGPMIVIGEGATDAGLVYVDDVVDALLACERVQAAPGRAYNLRHPEPVSWARYIATLARAIGLERENLKLPHTLAKIIASSGERVCSLLPGRPRPLLTGHALRLMSRDQAFPATRAQLELGWSPAFELERGMARTAEWWCGTVRRDFIIQREHA